MTLFEKYGVRGMIRLMRDVIVTRLEAPVVWKKRIRLIRRPVYIRGRSHISLGHGFTTGVGIRLDGFSRHGGKCIEIGDNVELNDYVHISAVDSVRIGDNVLIASKVFITDHDHGSYGRLGKHDSPLIAPRARGLSFARVVIEDNVWIGELVAVLPGVSIGKGSIIGALSVVTRDIPPNSIAVGSPAKVIKQFSETTGRWEPV